MSGGPTPPTCGPRWSPRTRSRGATGWNWEAPRRTQGRFEAAITSLERAISLRAAYPAETASKIARCYARLGKTEPAIDWLQRAVGMGLRYLDPVRQDDAFVTVRDDARFKSALGIVETETMGRDEGWRLDLAFLVREIERRAYNPYLFVSQEQFQTEVKNLERSIPQTSDAGIIVGLQRLITLLGDGHARIRDTP